jgi:hypothetical protein
MIRSASQERLASMADMALAASPGAISAAGRLGPSPLSMAERLAFTFHHGKSC